MIEVDDIKYELIKEYKNGYDKEMFLNRYTDYYSEYDYIVGDIAYSKLRLKGFYDASNEKVSEINNYNNLENYLKDYCAVDCKYFVLKKIK